MDFGKWIQETILILKLDEDAIRRAAADAEATLPAVVFAAIAGLAGGIGGLNIFGVILFPFLFPIFLGIGVGILWIIARLFGGTGEYMDQFRPTGLSYMAQWVQVVPLLGPIVGGLVGIYLIVVQVITVRTVHGLSTEKAIAVVLIPVVVCCCLAVVGVMAVGGLAALAAMSGAGS